MAQPNITSVGTNVIDDKQTGVIIAGSNFEAVQGTGKVEIVGSVVYEHSIVVPQTVTAWTNMSISITIISIGVLDPGYWWIFLTNDSGERNVPFPVRVREARAFQMEMTANIPASGANTTSQLAAPASGTTFGGGRIQDDQNPTDDVNLTTTRHREDEWCFKPSVDVEASTQYEYRTVVGGVIAEPVAASYPKWTVGGASAPGNYDVYLRSDVDKGGTSPEKDLWLRADADKGGPVAVGEFIGELILLGVGG